MTETCWCKLNTTNTTTAATHTTATGIFFACFSSNEVFVFQCEVRLDSPQIVFI